VSRRRRGALLLGLALTLGGLAASDVARREAAMRDQLAPLVTVVTAGRGLEPGRPLRAADLALRRIPARYAPVGAAEPPEELLGRKLVAAVPRGGYIGAELVAREDMTVTAPVRRGERAVEVAGLAPPELIGAGGRGSRSRTSRYSASRQSRPATEPPPRARRASPRRCGSPCDKPCS
jgi:pilus assembly protein CpaB